VTIGQTLYVAELNILWEQTRRVYMYDLDDSVLRLENPHQRKIACSNKRLLVLNSIVGDAELIVPCPHSNTLYVLEEHPDLEEDAVVHKVKQDGTVLSQWVLDLPWY